ncbi:MAG: Gfo/Idh/MocA family oxidoreductase [bacterium]|nr:Gfo/Idh/MocA family oxidoreductase [bacterium]
MHRRTALKSTLAALGTFHIVPRHVLGGPNHIPPSEKIHMAIVGAGGRGRQVLKGMMQEPEVRVLAVADAAESFSLQDFYYRDVGGRKPTVEMVEQKYAASEPSFRCAAYEDFHEMLETESDLDAVICGTPDHLHAYVSSACLRAGKHVYCEKPLTHNIWEARKLAELARETGLATQMGNQGHSTDGMRQTCEWIWAGVIGEVRSVKAWVSGHRWNPTLTGRPATSAKPQPVGLNWDLWLGPRAERPFNSAYFPVAWRDFWAFGNSNIGDFACHDLDAACWALELTHPSKINFTPAGPCNEEIGPHGCIGYYDFPATEKRGPVSVTWYDGGLKPDKPKDWPEGRELPDRGILFEGSEGIMFCGGAGGAPMLLPEGKSKSIQLPSESIPRVANHARDWLEAIQGKRPAGSNFSYGSQLTELALLGALSLRLGTPIHWDGPAMKAVGNAAADAIIQESYREGWQIA